MLYYKQGNIVDDDADILVNTVNCVGVSGAGVALAFAQKYPSIIPAYQAACHSGQLRPGGCLLFPLFDQQNDRQRYWAALATKDHWRYNSQYVWVHQGLQNLAALALQHHVLSIAIPPPGCGHGGLSWSIVHPLVVSTLWWLDLRIYAHRPES